MTRTDTFASRSLRWLLLAGFCWKIFRAYGFGWGASSALVLLATGNLGRRSPLVPVPGIIRIILELLIMAVGLGATLTTRGWLWFVLALLVTLVSLFLSSRRFAALLRERRA